MDFAAEGDLIPPSDDEEFEEWKEKREREVETASSASFIGNDGLEPLVFGDERGRSDEVSIAARKCDGTFAESTIFHRSLT